jgi:multidrug efflux pump subunit AcrA (membrane-fusion protein)
MEAIEMKFLYRALSTFVSCAVLFSGAYVRADDVSKAKSTTAPSPLNVIKPESSVVVFLKKMTSELRLDAAQKTAIQNALEAFQQGDERSLVRRDALISEDQQTLTSLQRMQNTLARVDASAKDTKLAVDAYKKFYAVLDEPQKKYVDAAFYKRKTSCGIASSNGGRKGFGFTAGFSRD